MTEKHMLPEHCLDIAISRHSTLQSKLRLWIIPDFRAKIARPLWFISYILSISVIEIGSDRL